MWLFPLIALACAVPDAELPGPKPPVQVSEAPQQPEPDPTVRVTLAAVGDLVPHQSLLATGSV